MFKVMPDLLIEDLIFHIKHLVYDTLVLVAPLV